MQAAKSHTAHPKPSQAPISLAIPSRTSTWSSVRYVIALTLDPALLCLAPALEGMSLSIASLVDSHSSLLRSFPFQLQHKNFCEPFLLKEAGAVSAGSFRHNWYIRLRYYTLLRIAQVWTWTQNRICTYLQWFIWYKNIKQLMSP